MGNARTAARAPSNRKRGPKFRSATRPVVRVPERTSTVRVHKGVNVVRFQPNGRPRVVKERRRSDNHR